jgi:hypothetical protein
VLLEILTNTTFVVQICYLPQHIKHLMVNGKGL